MIRTTMTMLALGALAISNVSAMAATKATTHHMKTPIVAAAEGSPAPAADEAKAVKEPKAHGKGHKAKGGAKAKDGAGAETPSTPAPEAPQK